MTLFHRRQRRARSRQTPQTVRAGFRRGPENSAICHSLSCVCFPDTGLDEVCSSCHFCSVHMVLCQSGPLRHSASFKRRTGRTECWVRPCILGDKPFVTPPALPYKFRNGFPGDADHAPISDGIQSARRHVAPDKVRCDTHQYRRFVCRHKVRALHVRNVPQPVPRFKRKVLLYFPSLSCPNAQTLPRRHRGEAATCGSQTISCPLT